MAKASIAEHQLYEPVSRFFREHGYTVRGEVHDCDLVAVRDDGSPPIIVELKPACNLTVMLQAIRRQTLSPLVYIAVVEPRKPRTARWQELCTLCKRVGVGLLSVTFTRTVTFVTEHVRPLEERAAERIHSRKQQSLLREHAGREVDYNTGGTTRQKRMTVYRQLSLALARTLATMEQSSPRELKKALAHDKVPQLLRDNVYGWFERAERGVYRLSASGHQALLEYADVLRHIR